MGLRPYRARILIAACVLVAASAESQATEYAFSTYGLGSAAFGAGVTPPPGTYVTGATAFYDATIGGALNFGGVIINAGAEVDGFAGSTNILYVPARKVLGGNLVPIGLGRGRRDLAWGFRLGRGSWRLGGDDQGKHCKRGKSAHWTAFRKHWKLERNIAASLLSRKPASAAACISRRSCCSAQANWAA